MGEGTLCDETLAVRHRQAGDTRARNLSILARFRRISDGFVYEDFHRAARTKQCTEGWRDILGTSLAGNLGLVGLSEPAAKDELRLRLPPAWRRVAFGQGPLSLTWIADGQAGQDLKLFGHLVDLPRAVG